MSIIVRHDLPEKPARFCTSCGLPAKGPEVLVGTRLFVLCAVCWEELVAKLQGKAPPATGWEKTNRVDVEAMRRKRHPAGDGLTFTLCAKCDTAIPAADFIAHAATCPSRVEPQKIVIECNVCEAPWETGHDCRKGTNGDNDLEE